MVSAGAVSATDQEGRWSVTSLPETRNGMETFTVGDVALFVGWTGPSTATVGTKVLIAGG
jgi:hypothetical protein